VDVARVELCMDFVAGQPSVKRSRVVT